MRIKKHQVLYVCKFIWHLQRPWFTVQFLNDPLAVFGFEDSELYINVTVYHCGPWVHNMPLHPFSSREIYLTVSRYLWSWFHVSGHMGNLYYCFRHLVSMLRGIIWQNNSQSEITNLVSIWIKTFMRIHGGAVGMYKNIKLSISCHTP